LVLINRNQKEEKKKSYLEKGKERKRKKGERKGTGNIERQERKAP
jgi:hypothetical protein